MKTEKDKYPMALFMGRIGASQVVLVVKNPFAKSGDIRDMGLIPG